MPLILTWENKMKEIFVIEKADDTISTFKLIIIDEEKIRNIKIFNTDIKTLTQFVIYQFEYRNWFLTTTKEKLEECIGYKIK